MQYIKLDDKNKPENFINVKYIGQKGSIAAGCEIISATMALKFLGYDIDEHTFVKKYLFWENFKKIGTDKKRNPIYQGPDPRTEAYAGNPYENGAFPKCGFGCFAKVIEKSVDKYFKTIKSNKHEVKAITGENLKDISKKYIEKEKLPILVWATMGMKKSCIGPRMWKTKNGEIHRWRKHEHCLLMIGFNDTHYFFADPYGNRGFVGYERKIVEERYDEMGKEAVIITPTIETENLDKPSKQESDVKT